MQGFDSLLNIDSGVVHFQLTFYRFVHSAFDDDVEDPNSHYDDTEQVKLILGTLLSHECTLMSPFLYFTAAIGIFNFCQKNIQDFSTM